MRESIQRSRGEREEERERERYRLANSVLLAVPSYYLKIRSKPRLHVFSNSCDFLLEESVTDQKKRKKESEREELPYQRSPNARVFFR